MLKKFAFFLPQYHEIKENNEWWGEGFTEWVNVKKSKPLYKNHKQPKEPLDGYYNLLEKKTVQMQTSLMKKNKLDGFIYYHYYFKGKKLLEKPAENLLKWKDIDQPFFFCWANHSWIKSWEGTKEVLIDQKYGNEKDWEEHFNYLLPFFKDDRYEKKDNKPLFMIFNSVFEEKKDIIAFFDKKCKENGFDGIYLINSCFTEEDYNKVKQEDLSVSTYFFLREPNYSTELYINIFRRIIRKAKKIINEKSSVSKLIIKYDGNKLLRLATNKMIKNNNVIHGLFFEWDNTPRHSHRGYIISPITKKTFDMYMNSVKDEEYLFINAWNEWAEGMMLEGTKENGYKYLEWIRDYSDKEEKNEI